MATTTAPVFVLIHSPLVGPLTWRPTRDLLRARDVPVVVPSLAGAADGGPPYYPKLAARVAKVVRAARPAESLVLVGHSGAGALLPAVAAACDSTVEAAVFVDAILPHPGASWFDTAPPALRQHLRDLAAAGRLPPWHQWFPPGTLDALLPDPDLRSRFITELPRLPAAYFEERAPVVPDRARRCGYLQLSAAYQDVADEAERRGWPTLREAADHLAMLTRPGLILDRLARLVERLAATA
jgi:hypothetical protein